LNIDIPLWDLLPYERKEKGHSFEIGEVQEALDHLKVPYWGNPKEWDMWQRNIAKGPDIIIPLLDAEVECKNISSKIYPSWIKKSYISRFTFTRRHKIVVTNWKWFIPLDCRKLLYEKGIKLMDLYEFIWWIVERLKRKNGILFNKSILNINVSLGSSNGLLDVSTATRTCYVTDYV